MNRDNNISDARLKQLKELTKIKFSIQHALLYYELVDFNYDSVHELQEAFAIISQVYYRLKKKDN